MSGSEGTFKFSEQKIVDCSLSWLCVGSSWIVVSMWSVTSITAIVPSHCSKIFS